MLEYSHGEIGWDVFTLEYKVDAPIDTILDPDSMVKYLKLFNHLWKMKRMESTLSQGWMKIAGASRTFLRLPGGFTSEFDSSYLQRLFQILNMIGIRSASSWLK